MALIRLFRVPKHRTYDYKPRYWDQDKEELHDRIKKIEEAKAKGIEGMRDRVRAGLQSARVRDYQAMRAQTIRSNVRLIVVVVVLIALTYLAITQYLPRLVQLAQ